MPRDLPVCRVDELAPGKARLFEDGGVRVAVFNVGGEFHAIDDRCTHREGSLNEGWMEGYLVSCPRHGWQFDVRTGVCATLANRDVARYPVRCEEGTVFVSLPDPPAAEGGAAGDGVGSSSS